MRISTRVRYGLRFLVALSGFFGNHTPVKLGDVAEKEHLFAPYLHQIALALEAKGFVKSVGTGEKGYCLSRSPESITVLDVVQALEGPIHSAECLADPYRCSFLTSCSIEKLWEETAKCLEGLSASTTLKDLVERREEL